MILNVIHITGRASDSQDHLQGDNSTKGYTGSQSDVTLELMAFQLRSPKNMDEIWCVIIRTEEAFWTRGT